MHTGNQQETHVPLPRPHERTTLNTFRSARNLWTPYETTIRIGFERATVLTTLPTVNGVFTFGHIIHQVGRQPSTHMRYKVLDCGCPLASRARLMRTANANMLDHAPLSGERCSFADLNKTARPAWTEKPPKEEWKKSIRPLRISKRVLSTAIPFYTFPGCRRSHNRRRELQSRMTPPEYNWKKALWPAQQEHFQNQREAVSRTLTAANMDSAAASETGFMHRRSRINSGLFFSISAGGFLNKVFSSAKSMPRCSANTFRSFTVCPLPAEVRHDIPVDLAHDTCFLGVVQLVLELLLDALHNVLHFLAHTLSSQDEHDRPHIHSDVALYSGILHLHCDWRSGLIRERREVDLPDGCCSDCLRVEIVSTTARGQSNCSSSMALMTSKGSLGH